jgi:hypothetical protein
MRLHRSARTCPRSRRLLVDRMLVDGWSLAAAEAAGVSERTAWKWVDRFRLEGEAGLEDRSSAPGSVPSRTPAERNELIVQLRRAALHQPRDRRDAGDAALHRRRCPFATRAREAASASPEEATNSYERPRPGELVRLDVKKLVRIGRPGHRVNDDRRTRSRGIGWEFVHVAVDDAARLAYVEVLDDVKGLTATGCRAVRSLSSAATASKSSGC